MKKTTIILSTILASVIFSGCAEKEVEVIEPSDKIAKNTQPGFFASDEERFYREYSKNILEKEHSNKLVRYYTTDEFITPNNAVWTSMSDFKRYLSRLTKKHQIILTAEAEKVLSTSFSPSVSIELNKKKMPIEEFLDIIKEKFDVTWEKKGKVFVIKPFVQREFYLPEFISFDSKLVDNSEISNGVSGILKKLDSLRKNKDKNGFVYDKITGHLYVSDRPSVVGKMGKILKEMKYVKNINFKVDVGFISFDKTKPSDINWEAFAEIVNNKYVDDIKRDGDNIIIDFSSTPTISDITKDVAEFLNYYGNAKIKKINGFIASNNKPISQSETAEITYVDHCEIVDGNVIPILKRDKEHFKTMFNVSLDKESKRVFVSAKVSYKEIVLNEKEVDSCVFDEKQILTYEKTLNSTASNKSVVIFQSLGDSAEHINFIVLKISPSYNVDLEENDEK